MATVETKLMTAEEFYEWSHRPENRDRLWELVRGEVVEMSRPGKRHGLICANVVGMLWAYVRQRKKGYVCSNDTGVVVERDPDTVRGPDVLLFEDADQFEQVDIKYGTKPPVLAVEVLSPNDLASKLNQRIGEQIRFGVRLIWVLDPEIRTVSVYGRALYRVVDDTEELTGEEVLPDFRCRVAEFFALPGQQ
jgi:Uma2 family endonuclease